MVWGAPTRFVNRRVAAFKSFLASRRLTHWANLWMAAYIATTIVFPRLEDR